MHRNFSDIINRLEKATGPDRWLDCYIAAVVEPHRFDAPGLKPLRPIPSFIYEPNENVIRFEGGGIMDVRFFPEVTASLDASIALVERMLPGLEWAVGREPDGTYGGGVASPRDEHDASGVYSPSIALLLAMFRALEAEAKP